MATAPHTDDGFSPEAGDVLAIVRRSLMDPPWWAQTTLGVSLWAKQREIMNSVRRYPRTNVRSCHGAGKTFVAAVCVLWFLFTHPGCIVITTAPTYRQVKRLLWKEIRRLHAKAPYALGGKVLQTELQVDLDEGWVAFGFSTNDSDSFVGHHAPHILVVFDEAAGIDATIFEAVEGVLSSEHPRFLGIGNPTDGTAPWADEFKLGGSRSHAIRISAFDTPNFTHFGITREDILKDTWREKIGNARMPMPGLVTPEWVHDKIKRWAVGSALWDARVEGNFPKAASDALFDLGDLEACGLASFDDKPNGNDVKTALGVDVARFGDDESTIYHRHGRRIRMRFADRKPMRTTALVGHVIIQMRKIKEETGVEPETVYVDDNGVGGGVTDQLVEAGVNAVGVNSGEAANDSENYLNRRVELHYGLEARVSDHDLDLDFETDEHLMSQLAAIRKLPPNSRGQRRIERKEDLKKRLPNLGSPDRSDGVMLSLADEGAGEWFLA